jgi:hypothetical protein
VLEQARELDGLAAEDVERGADEEDAERASGSLERAGIWRQWTSVLS